MFKPFHAIAFVAIAAIPAAAFAAPASPPATTAAQPAATATPFSAPLDEAAMSKATAREDTSMIAQSQQTSNVSNNTINGNSTTGDVTIADTAFQNASGLVLINANSGNNVAMNGSMNVNVIMAPAPPK